MRRAIAVTSVVIAALSLTGCSSGPPSHSDPRQGRVTITWSNCGFGSCIYDWKVCIGRTLVEHIDGDVYRLRRSPECGPR